MKRTEEHKQKPQKKPLASVTPISKEAQIISEFNKVYTTLVHGGKNYVLRQNTDAFEHNYLEFFNHKEFIDAHRDRQKIDIVSGGSLKSINPAKFWLESPESHSAKYGVTFHPTNEKFHNGKLNTYMGRGCDPIDATKSDVRIYLSHVHKVICNGDEEAYEYVIKWLAHLVQKPHEKPEVAIVLKAGQGTGKGTLVEPIGKIIGTHYLHAQSPEQVIGKFNAQLENKLLVFADEFFAGSKGSTDRLKTMITERLNTIERKGQDRISVPCFARIIMATNHENVIKIERDERRYLYLEVSEHRKQDIEYFNALHKAVQDPNFAPKALGYLQSVDITEFNPRDVPKTQALRDQKIDNLEPLDKWIYTVLRNGAFYGHVMPVQETTLKIQNHASDYLKDNSLSVWGDLERLAGKLICKMGAKKQRKRAENNLREYVYKFPSLEKMRLNFEKHINASIDW